MSPFATLETAAGEAALAAAASIPEGTPLHTALAGLRRQFEPDLASAAFEMNILRQRGRAKFSRADRMFFTAEGLEQSSGEIVARYRARRYVGQVSMADLCCGIGGDTLAYASEIAVTAVDYDPARLACCRRNLEVYDRGRDCRFVMGDVREFVPQAPLVFIDPGRREQGRRVRRGEDYSPPLSFVLELASRVEGLGAKLSPALDFSSPPGRWEREYISLDRVCRELALWSGSLAGCSRRATVLRRAAPHSFDFTAYSLEALLETDDTAPVLGRMPRQGDFILEPDPAVVRSHLFGLLAAELDARVLDPHIAYLVTTKPAATPFASGYVVIDAFVYREKTLREWLRARGVGNLVVKKRGFPLSPEEVCTRMRLKGPESATVILTRVGDQHLAILAAPADW